MFAQFLDGQLVKYPIQNIRQELPQVSFPAVIKQEHLPEGYYVVEYEYPTTFDPMVQKLEPQDPVLFNGKAVVIHKALPLDQEVINTRVADKAAEVRTERNYLLAESDWTQGKDISDEVSAKWAKYRQVLRDISSQPGFPTAVQWPNKPI